MTMAGSSLLYKKELPINEDISIMIPSVGEVLENEEEYYGLISVLTATPYDMMAQLDDAGIDFTSIDDYELFLLTFPTIKEQDTSLLFGPLALGRFMPCVNVENNMVVLRSVETGAIVDKGVYWQICEALRRIHHLKRNNRTPGNDATKRYLIDRQRKKINQHKRDADGSHLESLIVALVNTEQFSYSFDTVRDMSIYQFNESVQQVIKKIDFDNRMHGIYAGTVSAKDLSKDDLNWLTHR